MFGIRGLRVGRWGRSATDERGSRAVRFTDVKTWEPNDVEPINWLQETQIGLDPLAVHVAHIQSRAAQEKICSPAAPKFFPFPQHCEFLHTGTISTSYTSSGSHMSPSYSCGGGHVRRRAHGTKEFFLKIYFFNGKLHK